MVRSGKKYGFSAATIEEAIGEERRILEKALPLLATPARTVLRAV
jgi:hypothetical protein